MISGIGCLLIGPMQNHLINSYHPKITKTSVNQINRHAKSIDYNFNQVKSVTPLQVAEARWKSKENQYVGQIVAPEIDVHLPIGLGVNNNVLMLGAGTLRPDMVMGKGNYALAGHHMKDNHVLFSPFYEKAQLHMPVYITNMSTVYKYTINEKTIIDPTDINVINNTAKPILTLITCNDDGSKRLLIRAKLTAVMKLKDAPKSVITALSDETNNHDVLKGY